MKAMIAILRQRLIELIYRHQYAEWRVQSAIVAHWVRNELSTGLKIRQEPLGDGWLGIFEAELAKVLYNELVNGRGLCRFVNPIQVSPVDLYRQALDRSGIAVTSHVAQSLPEHDIRFGLGFVKAYRSATNPPIRLFDRWAPV